MAEPPITMQQMCELGARYLLEAKGQVVTWEEIWNASPTGELFLVCELYEAARVYFHMIEAVDKLPEGDIETGRIVYIRHENHLLKTVKLGNGGGWGVMARYLNYYDPSP